MRNAFIKSLTALARRRKDIHLLTGDLGFSVFEGFAREFPGRYLNCGVAEQNMMGVAAGLALSGKQVFVYSIVPFVTMRCFEQIRNDVCIQNLNVKIVGVGGGFSYGKFGPTHHAIEDIAVMRALPSMVVVCPADPVETELAVCEIAQRKGPVYLRLGRSTEEVLSPRSLPFELGKARVLRKGRDLTLIGVGPIVKNVLRAAELLEETHGIRATVASIGTVKPIDVSFILNEAKRTKAIFTIEEHNMVGGMGEVVATVLAERRTAGTIFERIGVGDSFVKTVGEQDYLRKENRLSPETLVHTIIKKYGTRK